MVGEGKRGTKKWEGGHPRPGEPLKLFRRRENDSESVHAPSLPKPITISDNHLRRCRMKRGAEQQSQALDASRGIMWDGLAGQLSASRRPFASLCLNMAAQPDRTGVRSMSMPVMSAPAVRSRRAGRAKTGAAPRQ
ncbi:Hypothetical predicted protein [Olea europaea subsp. europaea]|uniref:Uncharacterized protein n=1 Tax=Olea europaea subsp. europaea TaxID=158383 RepID=A0A8S0TFW3_OLEEU|nr:Hypothetical predicted protein [Olea europaea subsp. europaea]